VRIILVVLLFVTQEKVFVKRIERLVSVRDKVKRYLNLEVQTNFWWLCANIISGL
jgi:hypothetical protein